MADLRVDWDSLRGKIRLTATSKSVVTFNPSFPEAKLLAAFAEAAQFSPHSGVDEIVKNIDYKTIQVLHLFHRLYHHFLPLDERDPA